MKTHTCAVLSGVVMFAVALLLLQIEYPWSTYAAFHFSKWMTLISYLAAACIVAAAAAGVTALCLRLTRGSLLLRAVMCCVGVFVFLAVLSVLLGPGGYDVPGTRLNGIFFSEFEFLNFIFMVAAPASVAAAILCAWLARKQANCKAPSSN
jgi:hypothetical protein